MIKIKHVDIQNYRGIEHDGFDVDDGGIVFRGRNAIGKTSRIEAIYWCLTGVLFDNSSKGINDKIKTLKSGKKAPIQVSLKLEDELGQVYYVTKEVKEKWVTKKSSDIEVYDGDEITYTVNGTQYIKRDYDNIVDRIFGLESIKNEAKESKESEQLKKIDWFNLITNPLYFKKLDNKTQRALLIFAVDDYDVNQIEMSETLEHLMQENTFDDIKKQIKTEITSLKKKIETNNVKISTFQNDIDTLVCPKCGVSYKDAHQNVINKKVNGFEKDNKSLLKQQTLQESLLAETELLEKEYLLRLDEKVRDVFQEVAYVSIVDENMNPTLQIEFKDQVGHWVNMENGINTGDGILRLALFVVFLKMIMLIPQSIIFFDSLETLDENNFRELIGMQEQVFGTQVKNKLKTLSKFNIQEDL
jgi:AAA15 family ATPase/GTPase